MPRTVGIFLFDDVEVLDFAGPFEVFSVARPVGSEDDAERLFQPITIAETIETVRCVGGLLVQPHYTFANHPPLDLLIVPGGRGAREVQIHNKVALDWIAVQEPNVAILASVCTGAFLLAQNGLLDGRRATTYWSHVPTLQANFPNVQVVDDVRWVDEGHIVTSAGVSAGIDMSLHLVARLHDDATATWTARRMQYDWWQPEGK